MRRLDWVIRCDVEYICRALRSYSAWVEREKIEAPHYIYVIRLISGSRRSLNALVQWRQPFLKKELKLVARDSVGDAV
jgi:hypothetical protein